VDEGVTRLTERASFLELQPAPGAMRFARRAAQISHAALNTKQWANFTAKVETLCSEFIHAIERDRYSPAEVIQAACNIITAAIDETGDKDLAIQATQRSIKTSLERAKVGSPTQLN